MFGPSLLVAPVLTPGAKVWPVYLPPTPGGWYDWWTEKRIQGGQRLEVEAPLERIPLMVKAGSIVPLGPVEQYTGQDHTGRLELRVYPGADGEFTLYEDEGTNYAYEGGARATIPMHWNDREQTLTVGARVGTFPGMLRTRDLVIHVASLAASSDRHLTYQGREVAISTKAAAQSTKNQRP